MNMTIKHLKTRIAAYTVLLFIIAVSCNNMKQKPAAMKGPTIDQKVDTLLSKMSLAEKIGQMTQVDHSFLKDPKDIEKYYIGSLLSGGDSPKDPVKAATMGGHVRQLTALRHADPT